MVRMQRAPRAAPVAQRAQHDDERAFERFFATHYETVVTIAYKVLGDRQGAEDVAQEVFLSFHGRVDPSAEWAPGWLWAASAHRALNMVRGSKRRRDRELRVCPATPGPDPADSAVAAEQRRVVRAALARLPQRQGEVLVMRASGLSYADIASAVGVQPGSVGTLISRAQKSLRKELTRAQASL
ncbi:MAG TPA: sigma-70 family RNA polymerase sigma factor [Acidimicrobiales bacterium]|nr:sigma-70 family RNA polymerase sigma factor [Acidimicrobiales bacterium]